MDLWLEKTKRDLKIGGKIISVIKFLINPLEENIK